MSMSDRIPAILFQPDGNSISIRRVLKSAIELILYAEGIEEARRITTIEDLETMLSRLDDQTLKEYTTCKPGL